MRRWEKFLCVSAAVLAGIVIVGSAGSGVVAQVRAALTRDVDNPALAPFRTSVDFSMSFINEQRQLVTVPPGKRLVIEFISWRSTSATPTEIIFGGLRVGQFGPFISNIEVNPPHASAATGFVLQDSSEPVRLYVESGEDLWMSVSRSSSGAATFHMDLHGYYVTP